MPRVAGIKPGTRFELVSEELGWEDTFTVREAISRVTAMRPQAVRDALRDMVKHGTIERVAPGIYHWTYGNVG